MTYHVKDVCSRFSDLIIDAEYTEASFSRIDSSDDFRSDSLIFVSDEKNIPDLSICRQHRCVPYCGKECAFSSGIY